MRSKINLYLQKNVCVRACVRTCVRPNSIAYPMHVGGSVGTRAPLEICSFSFFFPPRRKNQKCNVQLDIFQTSVHSIIHGWDVASLSEKRSHTSAVLIERLSMRIFRDVEAYQFCFMFLNALLLVVKLQVRCLIHRL